MQNKKNGKYFLIIILFVSSSKMNFYSNMFQLMLQNKFDAILFLIKVQKNIILNSVTYIFFITTIHFLCNKNIEHNNNLEIELMFIRLSR